MYWNPDSRYLAGGFWRCAVKTAERMAAHYAANGDKIRARKRDHYDADPIYRIEKLIANGKRARGQTLKRHREADSSGALQDQG